MTLIITLCIEIGDVKVVDISCYVTSLCMITSARESI